MKIAGIDQISVEIYPAVISMHIYDTIQTNYVHKGIRGGS